MWSLFVLLFLSAQTRVDMKTQVQNQYLSIVEWYDCKSWEPNPTIPGGYSSCTGLAYARIRMPDGTFQRWILVAPDANFVLDNRWTQKTIPVPGTASGTQIR